MTSKDLSDSVGSRPIALVDNDPGTIHFLEERRKKLEQVNKKNLLVLKAQALKDVDDCLAEVKSDLKIAK